MIEIVIVVRAPREKLRTITIEFQDIAGFENWLLDLDRENSGPYIENRFHGTITRS